MMHCHASFIGKEVSNTYSRQKYYTTPTERRALEILGTREILRHNVFETWSHQNVWSQSATVSVFDGA